MMGRSRLFIAKNVLLRRGGGYAKTVLLALIVPLKFILVMKQDQFMLLTVSRHTQ
jgi:hypothetical protein